MASPLRLILTDVARRWPLAALALLSTAPVVAFNSFYPLIVKSLIDDAIVPGDFGRVVWLVGGLVGLLLLNMAGDLGNQVATARLGALVVNDLRVRLFGHLQRLSHRFYGRRRSGDLLALYTSDLEAVDRAVTVELPAAVTQLLTIVVGIVLLFALEWRLTLLCLAAAPLVLIGPRLVGRRAAAASYARQAALGGAIAVAEESLAGHLVVRSFGLERLTLARFERALTELADQTANAGLFGGLLIMLVNSSGYLVMVLGLTVGSFLALRGEMTVGSLVAFFELVYWTVYGLQALTGAVPSLQRAAAGLRRAGELLAEPLEIADGPGAVALAPLAREIRFEGVGFGYRPGQPSLRDVSLTIRAGQSVAFVGPSGCGKSTLLSLLMRLYDPWDGAILIDGRDLRAATEHSLHAQIGVVFQESFLFDATVRENIRLGRPEASDAEVEAAARAAEIHDFVTALPAGYDTPVGARGGLLSGGQRQRVAIARALLRDPAILLLDEATSALDAHAEAAIGATLRRLARTRTTIAVTHRLELASDADQIFVLEGGAVVERGTHAELLAAGGAYRRLWERQSGFVVSPDGAHAEIEAERLREIPLFAELDPADMAAIANRFVTERFAAGQVVVRYGEPGDRFYVIVRGTVEIVRPRDDGDELPLAVRQDGDFFGELALLENVPRTATVRARTPCLMLSLDRPRFTRLLDLDPRLRARVEQAAAARRREQAATLAAAGPSAPLLS